MILTEGGKLRERSSKPTYTKRLFCTRGNGGAFAALLQAVNSERKRQDIRAVRLAASPSYTK